MMTHHDFERVAGKGATADHDLFGVVPAMTQCCGCYRVFPLAQAHKVKIEITSTWTEEEHACSEDCAKTWWEAFQAREE